MSLSHSTRLQDVPHLLLSIKYIGYYEWYARLELKNQRIILFRHEEPCCNVKNGLAQDEKDYYLTSSILWKNIEMLNREDCYSIVAKCWDVSNFYNVHVGWASIPIEEYYNIKNKYLDRKGNDIFYEDIICPNCGCTVDTMVNEDNALWCGCGERFYKIKNT